MTDIKLIFAHICDSAFLSLDQKINIIGDFDTIKVSEIPGTSKIFFSFFIVTNFIVSSNGKYTQQIIIKSKHDGLEALNNTISKEQDKAGKIGFIGNFGVVFPKFGEYEVSIIINDSLLMTLPLNILRS